MEGIDSESPATSQEPTATPESSNSTSASQLFAENFAELLSTEDIKALLNLQSEM
jgi:hypothetical protein